VVANVLIGFPAFSPVAKTGIFARLGV